MNPPMKVGANGINLFKEWEGVIPHVYLDSGGAPTIGIGHLLTQSERSSGKLVIGGHAVDYRNELSLEQCDTLLTQDLAEVQACVNKGVKRQLTQNQFDALVSFTFNVGNGAFLGSTLLKRINSGDFTSVPDEFARWNKDNGHIVKGLINRRAKEVRLWLTP